MLHSLRTLLYINFIKHLLKVANYYPQNLETPL
jgi:hypothetical protein